MTSTAAVQFEPSRFDQAAVSYGRGRVAYAPALLRHTAKLARLGPESAVLDLGCGPGSIANRIAEYAGHVIGIDPSEGMITAARADAPDNVTYFQGSSFDLSCVDRPLALATFGRSFHWMDRDATLAEMDQLVVPGGCLAFFTESPVPGKSPDHAWWRALNKYFRTTGDLHRSDPKLFGTHWEEDEFPLARWAFSDISYKGVLRTHRWTYKRVVDLALSRPLSEAQYPGDRLGEYEEGLRETLKPFGPGPWTTLNRHRLMIARRPG